MCHASYWTVWQDSWHVMPIWVDSMCHVHTLLQKRITNTSGFFLGLPLHSHLIILITHKITDWIKFHSVLLLLIIIYPKTSKSLDVNSMKNIVKNQILQMKKSSSGSGTINNSRALYMASWDANSKKKEDKECWSNDKIPND